MTKINRSRAKPERNISIVHMCTVSKGNQAWSHLSVVRGLNELRSTIGLNDPMARSEQISNNDNMAQ